MGTHASHSMHFVVIGFYLLSLAVEQVRAEQEALNSLSQCMHGCHMRHERVVMYSTFYCLALECTNPSLYIDIV